MTRSGVLTVTALTLILVVTAHVRSDDAQANASAPDPSEGAHYIGAKKCKQCHFKQHRTWKKNTTYKHAAAWTDLEPHLKSEDQKDEHGRACLSCHATGFGAPDRSGFEDTKASAHLLGVQCEACHGPGSNHAVAGKKVKDEKRKTFSGNEKTFITTAVTACANCHNPHVAHTDIAASKAGG
jgi:hypothetical protein